MLIVADSGNAYIITGAGDVLEPEDHVAAGWLRAAHSLHNQPRWLCCKTPRLPCTRHHSKILTITQPTFVSTPIKNHVIEGAQT
jgi:hypothetical protein